LLAASAAETRASSGRFFAAPARSPSTPRSAKIAQASATFMPTATRFVARTPMLGNSTKPARNTPSTAPTVLTAYSLPTLVLTALAAAELSTK
jgi:hypothetical protein